MNYTPTKPRRLTIAEGGEKLKALFEKIGLAPIDANIYGGFATVYFNTKAEAEEALQYFIKAGFGSPRIVESYDDKGILRAFAAFADPRPAYRP